MPRLESISGHTFEVICERDLERTVGGRQDNEAHANGQPMHDWVIDYLRNRSFFAQAFGNP